MGNKWKVSIIVALIFVVGYLAGIGTLISLWYFKFSHLSYMGDPTRIMSRLNKTLNLNQEQKETVEQIVQQTRKDLINLRDEVKPKIRRRIEQARDEITTILNDEQRNKFNQFIEKRLARFKKMQKRMQKWREKDAVKRDEVR